jgi:transcriptional regulator with XRE-family HTH domain
MNTYGERLDAALAAQIKVELAEREMEQKALASALSIESATLSRYMTNKRSMPMHTFVKVAEAFGLSPYELMKRAEARIAAENPTEERLA